MRQEGGVCGAAADQYLDGGLAVGVGRSVIYSPNHESLVTTRAKIGGQARCPCSRTSHRKRLWF